MRHSLSQPALWLLAVSPLWAAWAAPGRQTAQNTKVVNFEQGIAPILKAHCASCHGGSEPSAGLDLTTFAGVMKGGASGKVVVPGSAEKSLIAQRLEGKGGKPRMPMGFAPLKDDQIKAVRAWIDQGAKSGGSSAKHWAYSVPTKPPVPKVRNDIWVRNPVDNFVLARLESEGLKPSPEAHRAVMLRRVYLDLIGLPPSPEETDRFLNDTSPDAYEKVVDRLLADPHFGERMARPWLDLARYADSDGYEADANRVAWVYRDWVIRAFNANMPYDQFTVEQLAGDMLPGATLSQRVATGFHRNTMFNREGGVDPAEAHYYVVMDRVATTATVWLGSTLACARCHDHKYDPFTQKDFYAAYAVFGNTDYERVGDSNVGQEKWYEPTVDVPSPDQARARTALQGEMAALEERLAHPAREVQEAFEAWLASGGGSTWSVPVPVRADSTAGQCLVRQADGSYIAQGEAPANDEYQLSFEGPLSFRGIRIEALPEDGLVNRGPGRSSSGNFILTHLQVQLGATPVALQRPEASFVQNGYDLAKVLAGDPGSGWAVYPQQGRPHELVVSTADRVDVPVGGGLDVGLTFGSRDWPNHEIGRFRVSFTQDSNPAAMPSDVRAALDKGDRNSAESAVLLRYFERTSPLTRQDVQNLESARKGLVELEAQIPKALVLKERPVEGDLVANIHERGEFLNKGPLVTASPPAFLSPSPLAASTNRLAFARWLVSRQNPLAARVEVNRLWEMVFGRGIVETSEDFGTQGARPTHPELLDWLAVRFMERGWDMKAVLRLIVTSATYRQSSDATSQLLQRDPANSLLARGPRFRMEAEMIRDNALAVAGLLSDKIGGPSVFPPQPPGIWNTPYNGEQWMPSTGADRYRRGIYTFWKRSSTYPSFMALDATSRDTCTVRRLRTNTPLQALSLLNDEVMVEAAKGLAHRMAEEGGPDVHSRIARGFRLCTGRTPNEAEARRLSQLFARLRQRYTDDPDQAHKLATDDEGAALVMVANTLLNLDETMTKG